MLLCGTRGQGQSEHVAPAMLHQLERFPVHVLDLPSMHDPETCSRVFKELRRSRPNVLFVPHLHSWTDAVHESFQASFLALLRDLEPSAPTLLLATCDIPHNQLPQPLQDLFGKEEIVGMKEPNRAQRKEFFSQLFLVDAVRPPPSHRTAGTLLQKWHSNRL